MMPATVIAFVLMPACASWAFSIVSLKRRITSSQRFKLT